MKDNFRTIINIYFLNIALAILLFSVFNILVLGNIDTYIDWIQLNTKKTILLIGVVSLSLMIFYKLELEAIKYIGKRSFLLPYIKALYVSVYNGVLAILLNFALQYFQKYQVTDDAIDWIQLNTKIFLAGALYIFIILVLFYVLIGNLYIGSFIGSLLFLLVGFIHSNKLQFLGEPLYPSDFKQVTHMKDVIPMVADSFSWTLFFIILLFVGLFVFMFKVLPAFKLSALTRVIVGVIALFLAYSYTFFPTTFMNHFVKMSNVKLISWNQPSNYKYNSFMFGFLSNLNTDAIEKPTNYTKRNVEEIAKEIKKTYGEQSSQLTSNKPNIIYVMSESFWDPTKLPNVTFNEDPMPNIREVMEQYPSGQMLSPTFGGGTANVEFEALTGLSMYFLKGGTTPYQSIIDKQDHIPTIVSYLKDSGYETVAIHPYNKAFYKRRIVYNVFGFDEFLHIGTVKYNEKSGPYVSDESITKEITDLITSREVPQFIHAVTMQNHFPYLPGRYPENKIQVSGLTPESKEELEVYTEGIRQTDLATKQLIDWAEDFEEPTLIVFWGDHLPILGEEKAIYKETGFGQGSDIKENEKLFSETPLFYYANFDTEEVEINTISPAFITPTLFDVLGTGKTAFYQFLSHVSQETSGLQGDLFVNQEGEIVQELSEEQEDLFEKYKLIQYDLLAGKQYSVPILFEN